MPGASRRRALRIPTAALVALALMLAGAATAQPSLRLDPNRLEAGDRARLLAAGLEPATDYVLEIVAPADAEGAPSGAASEETVRSDASGEIERVVELSSPGAWTLRLTGPDGAAATSVLVAPEGTPEAPEDPPEAPEDAPREGAREDAANAQAPASVPGGDDPGGAPDGEAEAAAPADAPEGAPEGDASEDAPIDAAESEAQEGGAAAPAPPAPGAGPGSGEGVAPPADDAAADEREPGGRGPGEEGGTPASAEAEAPDEVIVEGGGAVVARADGRELWRLEFPEGSGGTGAVLEHLGRVWAAHGASVLEIVPSTGRVERRYPLPARGAGLEPQGDEVAAIVAFSDGLIERVAIAPATDRSVRFGADPEIFGWTRAEADVADPLGRLRTDPTNPWLHLAASRELAATGEDAAAAEAAERAVERAATFYDLAGLSRELRADGRPELAERAVDAALRDFADRGYDPELLTSEALREAYGFPGGALEEALAAGDLEAADFWAPWAFMAASGAVGSSDPDTLRAYAATLRERDRPAEARLWRGRADAVDRSTAQGAVERVMVALGDLGWRGPAAMLVAILALSLTLRAKYWRARSALLARRRAAKGKTGPTSRLFAVRDWSFTEKLVAVLLFAAALALAALAGWRGGGDELPPVLRSGTLASSSALEYLDEAPLEGPYGAFARGYAAQVAGDAETARARYEEAGALAGALNNLGALEGDEALYQQALEVEPGMVEARVNLGLAAPPTPFHERYRPGEPLLAPPSPVDLAVAASGDWREALGAAARNPWTALAGEPLAPMPVWLWWGVLALVLLLAAASVLWLLIPRPRLSRIAPRTPLYHLLTVLLPGTGLADEAWGVLLLAPWAILGLDALSTWAGPDGAWSGLGLDPDTVLIALGVIYLINLVAVAVEFVSYRRRMRRLRTQEPELAREFGMRPGGRART